ncbi:YaaA family protein [Cellulomonas soli]|uniref:YaaA family protein n=1 Tax=Cellulomonas soli TaxID=931535 RepID=UPI003F87075C
MLVLLPPSEGKTAPAAGGPVLDLGTLSAPALNPWRERVLDALAEVSRRPDALEVLGVSAGLADEVARNTRLRTAATAPARRVYSGVLYAAAGLDRLTPAQRARATATVRIVSGLWGVVTPEDLIPAYRLSMGTTLDGVGALASGWRPHLGQVLDTEVADGVVVDCRSAAYAAAWRPAQPSHWVAVRVLREHAGRRTVVSHHAKHTRGLLVRHLITRRSRAPRDADELAGAATELVGTALTTASRADDTAVPRVLAVELDAPPRSGARQLSLVVS